MNPNFNRYDGRVAIVTGGADGIGKAISIRLATEGAKVCLFDKDIELLERICSEDHKQNNMLSYKHNIWS